MAAVLAASSAALGAGPADGKKIDQAIAILDRPVPTWVIPPESSMCWPRPGAAKTSSWAPSAGPSPTGDTLARGHDMANG